MDPALTIALAAAAGVVVQSLAHHLRLPGIVLLLGAGVLLGPDVLGVVQPETMGSALQILVGFAVAVILFEGGLNLNLRRIRREAGVIRQLLTVGVLVTAVGGAFAARLFMGWEWTHSILFGTLVIVTGPTVITPLLRRIKVVHRVESVFTLSLVLALFQISNFFIPESGIVAVTAAGMVMGNIPTRVQRDLLEFKEQLTVLFIGMLFVLLAADVRMQEVRSLGWPPWGL